jgi:hypothetical protein
MTASLFRFALVWPFVLAGAGLAWAQSAPTTRITEEPVVSQPAPFSTTGKTVVVPRTRIEIDEGGKRLKNDPRRKTAQPEAEGEGGTEAAPEPALDPGCRGSKILCGDPLRRKKKKREGE